MSKIIASPSPPLSGSEASWLDFPGGESLDAVLRTLRAQNGALSSLREALAFEETRFLWDVCVAA